MSFDDSDGKSTIVEFEQFLALIEGGGATALLDEVKGSERVLRTLRHHFPDKPLRYVLSSHRRPHRLSALDPFLDAGVTVVTTRHNFERLATVREPPAGGAQQPLLHFVEEPTWKLDGGTNRLVAHRFERQEYRTTPSDDYL